WLAAEAIGVEEALRIMTINGAYLLFMEDQVGSLKAGKLADLIILSDNPLTIDPDSLKDLEVMMTMVGGKVEYCAERDLCPESPE
ncbi:MAG: amidohydrolase family protein, partial [Dehalococcoidia bacterium]